MIARMLCLLFGYFCGMFQTGYIMSRLRGFDIRSYGSHSTGATNSLRVMGTGAGITVLVGDALKAMIPCLLVRFFYANRADIQMLMVLWTSLGVMLGHDYPFYLGFRGGKGVASTVGVLLSIDWKLALFWCLLFIAIVCVTRYVSLASILTMLCLIVLCLFMKANGTLPVSNSCDTEFTIIAVFLPLLSIWRHRSNVERLMKGQENRVNLCSKGMKTRKQ